MFTAVLILILNFLLAFLIFKYWDKNDNEEVKFQSNLGFFALFLRMFLTLILFSISYKLGNGGVWSFASDADYYYRAGSSLVESWHTGHEYAGPTIYNDYVYLVGALYWLLGKNLLASSLLNNFFGALTVVLIYKIAGLIPDLGVLRSQQIGYLAAVFPSFVLWSTQTLKDSLVILLICLIVYLFLRYVIVEHYKIKVKLSYVILLAFSIFVLSGVRNYIALAITFSIFVSLLFLKNKGWHSRLPDLLMVILIGLAFYLKGYGFWGINFMFAQGDIQAVRDNIYAIGNTGVPGVDISNPLQAIKFLPLGLMYLFFSPFPWQWFSLGEGVIQKLSSLEMIFWYMLVFVALLGIPNLWKNKSKGVLVVILFIISVSIPYALVIGNVGAIYRLRAQFLPFILILFCLGINWLVKIYNLHLSFRK